MKGSLARLLSGIGLVLLGGSSVVSAQPPPGKTNFLLITLDTLRADRLGCYGYRRGSTPRLDQLAAEGARLAQAVSSAPLTLPSHATIFTGLFPMGHGVRDNGTFVLAAERTTLAEIFKSQGYETAAFVSSFVVDSRFGLSQGFDTYGDFDDVAGVGRRAMRGLSEVQREGGETADRALAWLSRPRAAAFFLWVHLYDPHSPFEPPEPYRSRFADRPYDGEVAYTDSVVGRILDRLGALGMDGRTLVMVVSDHGESLGEHGEEYHSWFIYDSVLLVPFLVRLPGRIPPGQVIPEQVRLVDLAPTALDLLGLAQLSEGMHGVSLAAWLTGRPAARPALPAYAESLVARLQFGWGELKAIRSRGFKYIEAPRPELYDLEKDPGESRNLMLEKKSLARELREELLNLDERFRTSGAAAESLGVEIDAETARRLQSLGYLAAPQGASDPAQARIDPKDRIADYRLLSTDLSRAMEALDRNEPDRALALLKPLAQRVPGHSLVHHRIGQAHLQKREFQRAVEELEVVLRLTPRFSQARADLAEAYVLTGQPARGVRLLEEGLSQQPKNPVFLFTLGFAHHAQKDFRAALDAYRKARELESSHPQLLSNLAALYLQTGDGGSAAARLEELVEVDPDTALNWNNLGLARVQAGRLAAAGAAFQKAVELAPRNPALRKNLALWYQKMGRVADAERELLKAKELEAKPPR
jgi:choline-sulfatase